MIELIIDTEFNKAGVALLSPNSNEYMGATEVADENKQIIEDSKDIFEAKYLSDISFSSNDYTLNTLLSLLPKKIHIHLIDDYMDEFIDTLQTIFENKVFICKDCDICRIYKNPKRSLFKNKR